MTVQVPFPAIPEPQADVRPTLLALKEAVEILLGRRTNLQEYKVLTWRDVDIIRPPEDPVSEVPEIVNVVLHGTTAPSISLGRDGDYYIDTSAFNFYGPKAAGAWPAGFSLIGPAGATGPTGAPGTDGVGIPSGGTTGQVLTKASTVNYATGWYTLPNALSGMSDAIILSPTAGQMLKYNGANWVNFTPSPLVMFTEATTAEILANVPDKILSTDQTWGANAFVVLTDAATITPDFGTFINATVTLAGNRTLANPTNAKEGQAGVIRIVQDGTGSRTLNYGANWRFAGGTAPVLTTTAAATDILFYKVLSGGSVYAALVKNVS